MSYQVLARKWRPRSFSDMVGQAHVVRALSNALERGQLHHAYLFTGTRGVGKTTLARILSKALNCEQGVQANPCGQCTACREIDDGRFVDLLEVDAASRTKVDQTRELLDNVPFAPASGRFKVYLIDEVHMFSAHSFNALLKTLEEPPPHVKFLLATTDPQKLPVTVISRCLQFNLKRLLPDQITQQLAHILDAEGIEFEQRALPLLARAADGSMRDALSLLDQAIAFGAGRVVWDDVRTMLGTVGRDLCLNLVAALARLDGPGLLDEVAAIAELTPDFAGVLQELVGLLHQIALHQQVPATLDAEDPDRERILELAAQLAPEDLQLFYQIALTGQQDLALAPDPRAGIEMVLLRMLAFRPDDPGHRSVKTGDEGRQTQAPSPSDRAATASTRARRSLAGPASEDQAIRTTDTRATDIQVTRKSVTRASETAPTATTPLDDPEHWHRLVAELKLGGVASQLVHNCEFSGWDGRRLELTLDPEGRSLQVPAAEERLQGALTDALGTAIELEIRVSRPQTETPAQRQARHQTERKAQARALLDADPVVTSIEDELDARLVPGSIEAN